MTTSKKKVGFEIPFSFLDIYFCPFFKRGFENGCFFLKNACGTIMLSLPFFLEKVCYHNFLKKYIFAENFQKKFGHF